MSTPNGYVSVQVVYRQGQVKTFVALGEMPMATFAERVRTFGQPRLYRWMRDVKDLRTEIAAGAVLLEASS